MIAEGIIGAINNENINPEISIVIPTMNIELTKKCVQSIINYTNLNNDDVEIIIVANGADPKIQDYVSNLAIVHDINIKCLWFDEPLGAVIALNEGIKVAKGEFVLLLNDDCEILHSERNYWLIELLKPFKDSSIGCTGPFRMIPILGEAGQLSLSEEDAIYGFILFFCAMIRKEMFTEIGLLDEQLKCGVDIDFCMKLKRKGYKIAQVPSEARLDTTNPTHYTGVYPIWHQAEATVHDYYGLPAWNRIMKADANILEKRYGTKNKKISIVIPVYGNHFDDFQKCYNSIVNNTDMSRVEIIIIANGCDESIRMLCDDITMNVLWSCKYYWFDEALGATAALNKGIEYSSGDIIILLNQDAIILGNYWLDILVEPFKDPKVGITGPVKGPDTDIDRDFILFFCAAVRRKVIDEIGLLDEVFNPGGFEDIDFCVKAEDKGWKLVQVPSQKTLEKLVEAHENVFSGSFPIYHVDQHGEWMNTELFKRNQEIIEDRYGHNRFENKEIEITWPSAQKKYELMMIQEFLKKEKIKKVLEVGTYRGGTAMLWCHYVEPHNGQVFCCDLKFDWGNFQDNGYVGKEVKQYRRQVYNDSPHEKFVTEIQGDSHDPKFVEEVKSKVGTVDVLFIDGDHSYDGVKQDFENFYSQVKMNGYIIFHDIVDSEYHRSFGCCVSDFWNEIKDSYQSWGFIDQNEYAGCPANSMGIGIIKKDSKDLKPKKNIAPIVTNRIIDNSLGKDVLCFIATKNRYFSTLPLTLQSIAMQTIKPDRLIIYDDNLDADRIDLRGNETYRYLFEMMDLYKIKWEIMFGLKLGQHHGHQISNKRGYKFVWRLDDDEIAEPDSLEKLLSHMKDDVGAVGGVVLTKGYGGEYSTKIEDIWSKANIQWSMGNKVIEVDHLHSTFLYRANIADYNLDLSPVAHREETMFTHDLKEKGYKIIVDQNIIIHHLKQQSTGIRSHNNEWFYKHDEKLFLKKMESWGYKLINLNSGLGDHYAFLNILPALKKKYKRLIIGACFPEVFKDHPDITLLHISQSEPINDENIYKWMWDNNWKESIAKAYATYYEVEI
jgi:GT2 family glycosyltransferase/cephalosporin hydroxylase